MDATRGQIAPAASDQSASQERRSASRWSAARPLLIALLMPIVVLVGTALGVPAVALVGALGTLAVALVSPAAGLVALAFLAPTKPLLILPAPGFMFFLVAAIFVGYLFRLPIDRPRLSVSPIVLLVVGIGLYTFVQQVPDMASGYAGDEAYAIGYKFFQLSAAIGTVFAAALVLQGRSPYPVMAALLASALFVASLAIATFDDPAPSGALANLIPVPDEGARATGTFGNPNYFGFFIATATVLAVALSRFARGRAVRFALAGTIIFLGTSLVLSLSRGALVALVVGLVTLAFLRSRRAGFIVLTVVAATVLLAYPLFVELRLTLLTGSSDGAAVGIMAGSDAGRLGAVLTGPILWATSPIFGIGFGQYVFASGEVLGDGFVAHNWFMTVLAEQGLVGITLWVLLLASVVVALRRRPEIPKTVGMAILATTVGGFMFLHPPTAFQAGVLPAIVIAAALVADWSRQESPTVSPSVHTRGALVPRPR